MAHNIKPWEFLGKRSEQVTHTGPYIQNGSFCFCVQQASERLGQRFFPANNLAIGNIALPPAAGQGVANLVNLVQMRLILRSDVLLDMSAEFAFKKRKQVKYV